jgi:hypothetical protein
MPLGVKEPNRNYPRYVISTLRAHHDIGLAHNVYTYYAHTLTIKKWGVDT